MNGFQNFFGNRYGMDALNFTIAGLALVLSIVGRFFPQVIALPILGMLLIILLFYRMLSTKHVLRRAENEKFLSFWSAVRGWWRRRRGPRSGWTASWRSSAGRAMINRRDGRRPSPPRTRPRSFRG